MENHDGILLIGENHCTNYPLSTFPKMMRAVINSLRNEAPNEDPDIIVKQIEQVYPDNSICVARKKILMKDLVTRHDVQFYTFSIDESKQIMKITDVMHSLNCTSGYRISPSSTPFRFSINAFVHDKLFSDNEYFDEHLDELILNMRDICLNIIEICNPFIPSNWSFMYSNVLAVAVGKLFSDKAKDCDFIAKIIETDKRIAEFVIRKTDDDGMYTSVPWILCSR